MKSNDKKVAIIGAGPAGIAAAIQLKRSGFEPIIFEKNRIGGLLINANLVENYLGFPNGISGSALVELFLDQLQTCDINVRFENIKNLEYENGTFRVQTDSITSYFKTAVVASGTEPIIPEFPSIDTLLKEKVFYEVFPLINITNKRIAIIGAGDAAFDYALNLSRNNQITILNRSSKTHSLSLLKKRCDSSENITYLKNRTVLSISEIQNQLKLTLKNSTEKLITDFLLIAIGRKPCVEFLGDNLKMNVDLLTSDSKLFFIGDVHNGIFRQTGISIGDGIKAAMRISIRNNL